MRRFAPLLAAATLGTALLISGCGSDGHTTSSQSDLRAPVVATVDDPSQPVSLSLGDNTAPTDPVATDADGVLLPPQDVSHLGWWADSALPGSNTGTIVVTGHIDDASQGGGFAKKFSGLKEGDEVTLSGKDGHTWTYRVDTVSSVSKNGGLPLDELNRLDGPETLALVTCGGKFIGPPLGYENNDIAFASRIET
ncbi:class F sortase [Antrihabitans cavernicola]|uniref:Class F sortase n=1 Tax=Antrihabitans cavernicola TaxID=2495913 RepID=A0A5A7S9A3_9NOCA|nr:class F sortase [Spelaeibacter cavernicola]KAA0022486.1 class F sortase [Spelaeibacter cavernicola]